MENVKRITIAFIILLITVSPLINCCCYSYADDDPPTNDNQQWTNVTSRSETVAAFKAYCKARNYKRTHVPSDVQSIVDYDYIDIVNACKTLNINIDSLNAGIWYGYNNNGLLRFWFNALALDKLNDIYAHLLTQEGLSNGDGTSALYRGEYLRDDNGNGVYCFHVTKQSGSVQTNNFLLYNML